MSPSTPLRAGRLPFIRAMSPELEGWGFFLCTYKDLRQGRTGEPFISLSLQDKTGSIKAILLSDAARMRDEFDTGEFVKVQGHTDIHNGSMQLVLDRIRRINPGQDAAEGFREEDCVLSSPRQIDEMWDELRELIQHVRDPHIRELLERITTEHAAKIRVWPAALRVHHAYRGGFLEHILAVARSALTLGAAYGANQDLLTAGALLHDIGKLEELDYDQSTSYSREGNLVGHVTLGAMLVRNTMTGIQDFPEVLRTQIEHLVVSHHGEKEFGAPVEPMTLEAMILSAVDDLDSKINQVKQALAEEGDGEFTAYHSRLGRVLWRG
jgi:3'-5' exoribonuclease